MEPAKAGERLRAALKEPKKPHTVADASAASGLPLRDAERGLNWLSSEYRGQLRVTDQGELLHLFPHGFHKPWETRDFFTRAFDKIGHFLAGLARFVVRAWLTIVLLGYVAIFVAILIGLAVAQSNSRSSRRGGDLGGLIFIVFRVLADAMFWTFHPFSPFAYRNRGYGFGQQQSGWGAVAEKPKADEVPFYEKVNRFFFGPTPKPEDPHALEKRLLAEIRRDKGRIGLADVMRVTGLPREQADPMMARLMVDYDGDVVVSEEGGITYRFPALRKTAEGDDVELAGSQPSDGDAGDAFANAPKLAPFTGNGGGSNFLIVALNAFNMLMGYWAIDQGLTLSRIAKALSGIPLQKIPFDGTPIALGVVPLVFSFALFAIPLGRALLRPAKVRKIAHERGRLAVLREVITRVKSKTPVREAALIDAWAKAAGSEPAPKELTRELVRIGGDVQIQPDGAVRYRFADLETEAAALEQERAEAGEEEKKPGKVVFSSEE